MYRALMIDDEPEVRLRGNPDWPREGRASGGALTRARRMAYGILKDSATSTSSIIDLFVLELNPHGSSSISSRYILLLDMLPSMTTTSGVTASLVVWYVASVLELCYAVALLLLLENQGWLSTPIYHQDARYSRWRTASRLVSLQPVSSVTTGTVVRTSSPAPACRLLSTSEGDPEADVGC
ncbi:hypothetical protein D9619_012181 [Psilocybe cf. subviscida]|uniref:Uncharacterized protein n=1 Tax=Psilocybe cf. subviscida TaxID=2480587 RepID=A0A8H5B8S3_9AGAR|nr:hypothetical protein D9619_012181 [Psilocybe cf. subviscida]